MPEKMFADSVLFLVGGGVGSLVTIFGITRNLVSKSNCKNNREMRDTNIEIKLDAIIQSVKRVEKHQEDLYRDFYEPRIEKE